MTTAPGRAGTAHVEVRRGAYADSVRLLAVSRDVAGTPGVLAAQGAMATPLNVEVLTGMGFEVPTCPPDALVAAVRGEDGVALAAGLAAVEQALAGPSRGRSRGGATG